MQLRETILLEWENRIVRKGFRLRIHPIEKSLTADPQRSVPVPEQRGKIILHDARYPNLRETLLCRGRGEFDVRPFDYWNS
jgi:hypothetical protein